MNNSPYSWKAIFEGYTSKSFFYDSLPSIILSIIAGLFFLIADDNENLYEYVNDLTDVALTIIPVIASFVLTAYVLIQTFISAKDTSREYNTTRGRQLLKDINSSFAFCIIASIAVLLFTLLVFIIAKFGIATKFATWINRIIIVIIVYTLTYAIYTIRGVVADIFAFGQTSIMKLSEPKEFYYVKQGTDDTFLVCINWNYDNEYKMILLFEGDHKKIFSVDDDYVCEIGIYPTDQIPHPIGFKKIHINNKLFAELKKRVDDISQ